jgi:hypothetical protein
MKRRFNRFRKRVREYPSIIFISFDIRKDDYPSMNYSIASLIASLKKKKIKISHYSFDLQHALEESKAKNNITSSVNDRMIINLPYFQNFNYIAISRIPSANCIFHKNSGSLIFAAKNARSKQT